MPSNGAHCHRFSFDPLYRYVCSRVDDPNPSLVTVATVCHVAKRTIIRWQTAGLTITAADNAAVAIGVHPSLIWPDWWSAGLEDPAPFVTV